MLTITVGSLIASVIALMSSGFLALVGGGCVLAMSGIGFIIFLVVGGGFLLFAAIAVAVLWGGFGAVTGLAYTGIAKLAELIFSGFNVDNDLGLLASNAIWGAISGFFAPIAVPVIFLISYFIER